MIACMTKASLALCMLLLLLGVSCCVTRCNHFKSAQLVTSRAVAVMVPWQGL